VIRHAVAAACLVLAVGELAAAHEAARVEARRAGPYRLEIAMDRVRPTILQPLHVTVRALAGGAPLDGTAIAVVGVPGPETDAVPTRPVRMEPATGAAGGYAGAVLLSVRGGWDLEVRVSGPAGAGVARVPVEVTAPWVVPEWIGWLVGLSPLVGLGWFAWWQRGYARALALQDR